MNDKNILSFLFAYPRFNPTLIAAFLGGILLLFVRDLGYEMRRYFIPSLFVYALATSLLGTFHRLIAMHFDNSKRMQEEKSEEYNIIIRKWAQRSNNEQTIPKTCRIIIYSFHIVLFGLFIWYNFHHCTLSW